ncbi:uncharacterized protein N0V89_006204 [Didymosphaeria variabile]|uniref:NAD(P)-binding protein n=1 Tax=Didymosphaeria variabile TaxID=1932322 RepID=A0A9W8XPY3_9PLEO|nr:uncharacterized protein N0V89_006204 [Didymosphaeria variabile]KAJ4354467.1 hypothetical protein N0V89_006204 [Didymosphaeria variabile]
MGLATAKLLSSRGATISLADINQDAMRAAVQSLSESSKHMWTVVDVRDPSSVGSWVTATKKKYGRVDGAVNMAGIICQTSPVAELSDDDWDRSFAVNTKGVFNCIRAQLNAMGPGGSIVSAASVFGQFGAPGNAAYCATKAAVISLTRTAAKENQHIRVNCVSPGEQGPK